MYDNNVYYLSKNDRHLYRANDISGEEELINIKRSIKLPLMMGGYIIRNRTAEKRAAFFIV